jgi:hypothetical protein
MKLVEKKTNSKFDRREEITMYEACKKNLLK